MTDDELTARLAWSRKQMLQRKNKPMAKHANEVFGVGVSESRESVQTGQRALAHVKADNSDADSVCRDEAPTPKEIRDVLAEMLEGQEPLPPEFAKVLEDNAWSFMSDDEKEAYEERAGILEFDAGMSRADAEKMAATMVADDEEAEFTMGAGD